MGTLKQYSGLQEDLKDLRSALKGLLTNEKKVIQILGKRSQAQRESIAEGYQLLFGENLLKRLKASLSTKIGKCFMLWMMNSSEQDAVFLYEALREGGPKKDRSVIGILCTRNFGQIYLIKQSYNCLFNQTLESHLDGTGFDFSEPLSKIQSKWAFWRSSEPKTKVPLKRPFSITKLLLALVRGSRPDNKTIDRHIALTDAHQLNKVCTGKLGNEETLIRIFSTRSSYQLTATLNYYQQHYGHDFEKALSKKDAGEFLQALLTVVQCLRRPSKFYAEELVRLLLETKETVDEDTLLQIITTRAEVDMQLIKLEFMNECKRALEQVIGEKIIGNFGQLLVTIISQRDSLNSRPTSDGSTNSYYASSLSSGSTQLSDSTRPDSNFSPSLRSSGSGSFQL